METVIRNVRDIDRADRPAVERVVGHPLREGQRLVIQVIPPEPPSVAPTTNSAPELPEWTDVYQGLSDAEIDDLDSAIRERANLSRPTADDV